MLDVDTFLTALYVMVDDFCQSRPPKKRPGPNASLSDSEAITLAIFARWGRFSSERDFYRYARSSRLRGAFPTLPDRSQFNRLIRSCVGSIEEIALHLALMLDPRGSAPYEALDASAMPVRDAKRRGEGSLAGFADIGWSNSLGWYEGFRLLVAVNPAGVITPALASPPLPPRISRWPKPSSPCALDPIPDSRAWDLRPGGRTCSTRASRARTTIEDGSLGTGRRRSSVHPNAASVRGVGPSGSGVGRRASARS